VAPEAASEEPDAASEDPPRYVVTDAGMAGGMSGGPLIDCEGRVRRPLVESQRSVEMEEVTRAAVSLPAYERKRV
jgi:hypothetical protein